MFKNKFFTGLISVGTIVNTSQVSFTFASKDDSNLNEDAPKMESNNTVVNLNFAVWQFANQFINSFPQFSAQSLTNDFMLILRTEAPSQEDQQRANLLDQVFSNFVSNIFSVGASNVINNTLNDAISILQQDTDDLRRFAIREMAGPFIESLNNLANDNIQDIGENHLDTLRRNSLSMASLYCAVQHLRVQNIMNNLNINILLHML